MDAKTYWPSKWIFILAAVGSAAGLGNIWRFPYLAFEHGGGAFVLALLIANIIIGIPLLALEVGLGQMMQKGASGALGSIKRSFKYVGWTAVMLGSLVLIYYMSVVGWSLDFLKGSFSLAWGSDASSYFFGNVLQLSDGVGMLGGISWPLFIGLLIAWVLVYFSVWKGVKSISKVVVWTATLPFLILAVLIIRAVTLPGAGAGIATFLIPQWEALADPQLWLAAFSQVFFSLSLAFGIMIAYGSLNRRESAVTKPVTWIVVGNFLVSLMSGFVVFGTLGYMATTQGVAFADVVAGGPSLAFVVFPTAISLLPALKSFFAVLFFFTLLTLALDSAFSLLEAVATSIREKLPHVSTKKITLWLCTIGFVLGIPFVTGAGLYILDIVDHFIVNYGLVIVGILEALIVGWFWKKDELRNFINERSHWKLGSWWNIAVGYVIPLFLGILLVLNLINEFKEPYGGYPVWALLCLGVLPVALTPVFGWLIEKFLNRGNSPSEPSESENEIPEVLVFDQEV